MPGNYSSTQKDSIRDKKKGMIMLNKSKQHQQMDWNQLGQEDS